MYLIYSIEFTSFNNTIFWIPVKNDDSIKDLLAGDRTSQKVTNILVIYFALGIIIIYSIVMVLSMAFNFHQYGYINAEKLFKPYPFILPWDVNTLLGWLAYNVFFFAIASTYYVVNGMYLSLYLAICFDFRAFRKQFESICNKLNAEAGKVGLADGIVVDQQIRQMIELHIYMKE